MVDSTTFLEGFKSRRITLSASGSFEVTGTLRGMPDDTDDAAILIAAMGLIATTHSLPTTYYDAYNAPIMENYYRNQIDIQRAGQGVWNCVATYKRRGKITIAPGVSIGGLSIGEQTQRIKQSILTYASYNSTAYGSSGGATDFKNLINVTHEGQCEGCDWGGGAAAVRTVRQCFESSDINDAYLATICSIQNTMNSGTYLGFGAYTLRFLGCDLNELSTQQWEGIFRFGFSPHETVITIGDMTNIEKDGWDYLWVYYEPRKDGSSEMIRQVPISAYVEQIYYPNDFSDLKLNPNTY